MLACVMRCVVEFVERMLLSFVHTTWMFATFPQLRRVVSPSLIVFTVDVTQVLIGSCSGKSWSVENLKRHFASEPDFALLISFT